MASNDMDEATAALIAQLVADDFEDVDAADSNIYNRRIGSSWEDYEGPAIESPPRSPQLPAWGDDDPPICAPLDCPVEEENTTGDWNKATIEGIDDSDDDGTSTIRGLDETTIAAASNETAATDIAVIGGVVDPEDNGVLPPTAEAKGKGKGSASNAAETNEDDTHPEDAETDKESKFSDDDIHGVSLSAAKADVRQAKSRDNARKARHPSPPRFHTDSDDEINETEYPYDYLFQPCERLDDPVTGGTSLHITIPWSFCAASRGIVYDEEDDNWGRRGRRRRKDNRSYDPVEVCEIHLDEDVVGQGKETKIDTLTEQLGRLNVDTGPLNKAAESRAARMKKAEDQALMQEV